MRDHNAVDDVVSMTDLAPGPTLALTVMHLTGALAARRPASAAAAANTVAELPSAQGPSPDSLSSST